MNVKKNRKNSELKHNEKQNVKLKLSNKKLLEILNGLID